QHIGQNLNNLLQAPLGIHDFIKQQHELVFRCEGQHYGQPLLLTLTRLLEEESAWLLTIVNISEVRKLERQLAEQDKLASIGQMSAMLAHEIRNPMQTIAQAVELMGLGNQTLDLERIVADEISRLNRLVSDMLDYAQPRTPEPATVSCSEIIGSSVVQVDMQGEYGITWHSDIDSLMIDPGHFRLVLDNLLRNAVQASSHPNSIEIVLGSADDAIYGTTGGYWELSIEDQGGGVSAEMKEHLFEPFATGRAKGIGLGLATVWQVCQVNGWHAEVKAVSGGSRFIIRGEIVADRSREVANG
ncbi:MAG: ATP-binding protein, partial [Mariprofundaceae bacterium]